MYTEVLTKLTKSRKPNGDPDCALEGEITFQGAEVSVCSDPDDEEIDATK